MSNPVGITLLADYFPKEKRATANAIFKTDNYIGGALGSLIILAIRMVLTGTQTHTTKTHKMSCGYLTLLQVIYIQIKH